MTLDERRQLYKEYLVRQGRLEATVNNYVRKLDQNFPNKLESDTIFSITDISLLENISNKCDGGDLEEWSFSDGNHAPRAAINNYIKFLKDIDRGGFSAFYSNIGYPNNTITAYLGYISENKINLFDNINKYKELSYIDRLIKLFNDDENYQSLFDNANFAESAYRDFKYGVKYYKKYFQYSTVIKTLNKYDQFPNDFDLNGAYKFFKISQRINKYPIKEICRKNLDILDLNADFSTSAGKEKLKNIFGESNIIFIDQDISQTDNITSIKNIILYGAPGVGKTHNYKKLISLIEEGKSQKDIFHSIKSNEIFNDEDTTFQNIKRENRIEFITFHQSFGYEDFIEGFRPNEEGKIELEDGIFKQIAINAKKTNEILDDIRNIDFNDYLNVNQEFRTKHGKRFFIVSIDEDILFEHEKGTQFIAYRNKIINHLLNEEIMTNDSYYSSQVYIAREIYKKLNIRKKQQKNFYLIIDEINRGNISKIFGELITLIEELKRDTYEVTLPYSKQKFSVPSNLYIIGTMNTTDKSIALIDVALRRRFTFIKMQPNSDLVLASFKSIFEKLNEQIKVDLGEEYQIGHSYFMNIDESDLDFVKEYKIKPLLEEYYYGDEKLNEVLKIIGVWVNNEN